MRPTPRPVASVPLSSAPAHVIEPRPLPPARRGRPARRVGAGGASGSATVQPRPVAAVVTPAAARPSGPAARRPPRPRSQPAAPPPASASPVSGTDPAQRRSSPGRKLGSLHPPEFALLCHVPGRLSAIAPGSGPLSKHTPHRGTGIRPGGGGPALTPSAESRPSRTQGSPTMVPGGQEAPRGLRVSNL